MNHVPRIRRLSDATGKKRARAMSTIASPVHQYISSSNQIAYDLSVQIRQSTRLQRKHMVKEVQAIPRLDIGYVRYPLLLDDAHTHLEQTFASLSVSMVFGFL